MKRIIVSWALVMSVVIVGMSIPENSSILAFLAGFYAGAIGVILGMWNNEI